MYDKILLFEKKNPKKITYVSLTTTVQAMRSLLSKRDKKFKLKILKKC